ncbi:hypothetical protein [Nocardia flavorosea]|uniref:WXG100 family type VII secretion target n=1 Tax=Nocardia flavorosea TaxID=53429 RepID=A0A846YAZ8_9NOCA|nr:hypothetical protein [Nocardia flavorosea]NKY54951.1 hypothetical protein [Nocardia flavorosea]
MTDFIQYSKGQIIEMVNAINTHAGTMDTQIEELGLAGPAFRDSLAGAEAQAGFDATHSLLMQELADTTQILRDLNASAGYALDNMIAVDRGIGQGFDIV